MSYKKKFKVGDVLVPKYYNNTHHYTHYGYENKNFPTYCKCAITIKKLGSYGFDCADYILDVLYGDYEESTYIGAKYIDYNYVKICEIDYWHMREFSSTIIVDNFKEYYKSFVELQKL